MDPKRQFASQFMEESLGLAQGSIDPGAVPSEFVGSLVEAMSGAEAARAPEPALESTLLEVGRDVLQSTLETSGFVAWKERWPRGAKYAACLTHDVDSMSWPVSHLLRQRSRFSAKDYLLGLAGITDPYDNTAYAVEIERQRNLHSSFYFLTEAYNLGPKAGLLADMRKSGWEVGLHGDFGTHDSAEKMATALRKLEQVIGTTPAGVREHYLRFDYESTWRIMEGAGLVYDSTVGNTDRTGFRIGLCNPFHPPGKDWKPLRLLEIPLGLMDVTLWGYLKRDEAKGLEDFLNLKKSVEAVNGLFTILWHPESFKMKGGRIYPKLLDLLIADQSYIGSGLDLVRWWSRRASPLLVDGKAFTMDDAPRGLVLRFKSKGGEAIKAAGGEVRSDGESGAIEAAGGPLEVTLQ